MNDEKIKELLNIRNKIQEKVDEYSEKLNNMPKLPNGLISDEIKKTKEYKLYSKKYDIYFKELQNFNSSLTNKQKRELRKFKNNN